MAGVFGLAAIVLLAAAMKPAELRLDEDGLEYRRWGRGYRRAWREIDRFVIYNPLSGLRHERRVGYVFRTPSPSALAQVNRALGCDRYLPGGWRVSPQALLELLQEYHAAYGPQGSVR